MSKPVTFPDWALTPAAQGSLNEQQTVSFVGTPVQGSYVLSIGTANSAPINWNDNAAAVQAKINAIYAPGTAVVSGGPAPTSLVVDFGVFSQTNLVAQMTVSQNTLLTAGNAQVIVTAQISQSSQEPATVPIDTFHTNNGWSMFEFPPFNLFNFWMNLVGLWIQWFNATMNLFAGEITITLGGNAPANWNPTGWTSAITNIIVTSTQNGTLLIDGLLFQANGQIVNIINNTATGVNYSLTIKDQAASSSAAANRFASYQASDLVIPEKQGGASGTPTVATFIYSGTLQRWLFLGKNF